MSIVKLNNRAVKDITTFGSVSSGSLTFIKKITADNSSTISFVDGSSSVVFDSTYKEYLFTFKNLHPELNACDFMFQVSTNSGSSYGVAMTTTCFQAYHQEDDNPANLNFRTGTLNSLGNDLKDTKHKKMMAWAAKNERKAKEIIKTCEELKKLVYKMR